MMRPKKNSTDGSRATGSQNQRLLSHAATAQNVSVTPSV